MAKKNTLDELGKTLNTSLEDGGKSFKPGTGKFDTLHVNESITGFFIGARSQTIEDQRTRRPKDIFVLKLREDDENEIVRKIPCAAMMLQAWDDIVDDYGNGDESAAITNLRGKKMTISRGEDSQTKGGNQLGQYEIIVYP